MTDLVSKGNTSLEGVGSLMTEETVVYLLDISGSMGADMSIVNNNWISKLNALKEAVNSYLTQREITLRKGSTDKVGFVTFGHNRMPGVRMLHEPSDMDLPRLRRALSSLMPDGGTPMLGAVEMGINALMQYDEGLLRLVVISDGQPDESKDRILELVSTAFNEYGIVIDSIGIGSKDGYRHSLDSDFMSSVAKLGGGVYTEITDSQDLAKHFLAMEEERALLIGSGILMLGEGNKDVEQ